MTEAHRVEAVATPTTCTAAVAVMLRPGAPDLFACQLPPAHTLTGNPEHVDELGRRFVIMGNTR